MPFVLNDFSKIAQEEYSEGIFRHFEDPLNPTKTFPVCSKIPTGNRLLSNEASKRSINYLSNFLILLHFVLVGHPTKSPETLWKSFMMNL